MKLKICFTAALFLSGIASLSSQNESEGKNKLKADSLIQSRLSTRTLTDGSYQKNGPIYRIADVDQTSGGDQGNFNNIISGRNSTSNVELEKGKSSRAGVFYSEAPMYFGVGNTSGSNEEPVCYIEGSFFADVQNGAMMSQQGITELTGDFIVVEPSTTTFSNAKTLFAWEYNGSLTNEIPNSATNAYKGSTLNPEGYSGIYYNKGTIRFSGLWNVQRIEREDENQNPVQLTSFSDENKRFYSILNFPKVEVVKDGFEPLTGLTSGSNEYSSQKLADGSDVSAAAYDPYKMGFVSVATNVAVTINELDLTAGGRFSVDAISSAIENQAINLGIGIDNSSLTQSTMDYYKVNYGYVDIAKMTGDNEKDAGYSELNMRLYNYDPTKDFPIAQNDAFFKASSASAMTGVNLGSGSQTYNAVFLRGMTSPFEELRSDYMFYNLLTKPENGSMGSAVDGQNAPLIDPKTIIVPGASYFYALDPSDYQYSVINEKNELGQNGYLARSRGGYNFSRFLRTYQFNQDITKNKFLLKSGNNSNWGYTSGTGDKFNLFSSNREAGNYSAQRFNSDKVKVRVKGGDSPANAKAVLLGNPYLAPINLGGILWDGGDLDPSTVNWSDLNSTQYKTPFKVKANGTEVPKLFALHNAEDWTGSVDGLLIRSKYMPVNSAMVIAANDRYYFSVKYDNADIYSSAATTPPVSNSDVSILNKYIYPLQVFAIYAVGDADFTFIPEMKVNGLQGEPFKTVYSSAPGSGERSLRSEIAEDQLDNRSFIVPDWFVIEAVSEKGDYTADRTAVRFFENGKQAFDTGRDVMKNVYMSNSVSDEVIPTDRNAALLKSAQSKMNISNTLYTTSLDGTPLLSNNVGYKDTKEIPLYYTPSGESEKVKLSFSGISGFDKLNKVWLVDRFENNKMELKEGSSYEFITKASYDDSVNRFLLVFDEDTPVNPVLPGNNITTFYNNSTLFVGGLGTDDAGSILQIFDMQGRVMGTTKIPDGVTSMEYPKTLGLGTFVVKITGKRNYNSKFVNTQNYR